MKVTIKKDTYGREVVSCKNVNGNTQHLRADYVFTRASDGAVLIGDGQGLREVKADDEIALTKAIILIDK